MNPISWVLGFSFPQKLLTGLIGISVIAGAAYLKGRSDGKATAAVDMLETVIQDNKDWNNALSDAERLDAIDRCVAVGGLQDDCERILRNQSPASGQ